MFWGKYAVAGTILATGCLMAMVQPANAGVVVSSSGPSASQYPVGKKIGDSDRITLRAGDSLYVLDSRGTRVLRGAGTYTLGQQSARASNRAFASLTAQRSASRARTGAVRNDGADIRKPNLWYVDVTKSGATCLPNADLIRLWRADTSEQRAYTLRNADATGTAVSVTFPQDEMLSVWSETVPVVEDQDYLISTTGSDDPARVSFHFMGDIPTDPEDLAAALIGAGCTGQLEDLSTATLLAPE